MAGKTVGLLLIGGAIAASANVGYAQQLEEVMVTAQGRSESIQDTPLSINALQGEKLENSRLNRLEDLQDFVPNLSMTQTGISTQIYVRGIGTGNNQGFEQSVAQFIDGVYYGRQQQLRAPFFDLDRVEVLRGPQPILFGKNAVAGAISAATAKATDDTFVKVLLGYEFEQDAREMQAILNGPITDSLNGRISVRSFDDDGYVNNSFKGKEEPVRDELAVRLKLDWAISDNLLASYKAERDVFDVEGRQIEVLFDNPNGAGADYDANLSAFGFTNSIENGGQDFTRRADADEFSDNVMTNHTVNIEWGVGEYTITSTTAKVSYEFDEICDCDFVAAPVFDLDLIEDYDQFSQEIRVVSPVGERVDWIAGVYYQNSELKFIDQINIRQNSVLPTIGRNVPARAALVNIENQGVRRLFEQETDVYSAFGQVSFAVADRVRTTLGLRYTLEDKDAEKNLDAVAIDGATANPIAPAVFLGVFDTQTNQPGGGGHSLSDSRKEEKVSAAVNVEWDMTDDVLLYTSVTSGFKSGGFDARSNTPASFEFEDEEALAFEAGAKTTLMDGRLELNGTYYYTKYNDLQISQFDGTLGFNVGNIKETIVQGLEFDGRFSATEYLTMNYSVAWLDHEYEDFKNGNCFQGQTPDGDFDANGNQLCDYTGRDGQYTPEYSASIGFEYLIPLGDMDLRFLLDANWVDDQNVHVNIAPQGEIDAYTLVDVGVVLSAEDWSLSLLVKNATDENFVTYQGNAPLSGSTFGTDTQYGFINQPRTVILQASKTFREF